jgi:hypothetical protein
MAQGSVCARNASSAFCLCCKPPVLVIHVAAQVSGQCTGYGLAKVAQAADGTALPSSTVPAGASFQYKLTVSFGGTPPAWNAGQLHIGDILPSGVELDGSQLPTGCQSTNNANVLCTLDPAVTKLPADLIIPVKVSSSVNTGVANLVITNTAGLSAVITVNGQQQSTPCTKASASITVPPVSTILLALNVADGGSTTHDDGWWTGGGGCIVYKFHHSCMSHTTTCSLAQQ